MVSTGIKHQESCYLCLVQQQFSKHIRLKQLFTSRDRLVLAISGGADSVVLAHLLKAAGFGFSLAHCNFKLRGSDSDADEFFCRQLAQQLNVEIDLHCPDAAGFAKSSGQSLQMAARQLRYDWFRQVLQRRQADYLLTAHNAGDVVETLFINLLRGTGINGLKGIPEKNGNIIRPLLPFTKAEILEFAAAQSISYREDKSNAEPKYERNFLRLKVIPLIKEWQPSLEKILLSNIAHFKEEAEMVQELLAAKAENLVSHQKGVTRIRKAGLGEERFGRSLMHYLLDPFGFNSAQAEDVFKNISGKGLAGKLIFSSTHTLTIDRNYLLIKENTAEPFAAIAIPHLEALEDLKLLRLNKNQRFERPGQGELLLDPARLVFPLLLRAKARGDKFKPFGMRGFKLLSDFFKDQKLNNFEKENCKLLVNGNGDIIWVLGYRSDERYRVSEQATGLIKLSLID